LGKQVIAVKSGIQGNKTENLISEAKPDQCFSTCSYQTLDSKKATQC